MHRTLVPAACLLLAAAAAWAGAPQPAAPDLPLNGRAGRNLALDQFRPRAMLRVAEHPRTQARFPAVDVHSHFRFRMHHDPDQLDQFVRLMDRHRIAVCASLDGGLGDALEEHQKFLWTKYRQRFVIFATIDWQGSGKADDPATWDCHRPDFAVRTARQLVQAQAAGASGLKVFKQLGLEFRNPDGSRVQIDDPRWDPIWEACGQLGWPVLIHTADPAAFFLPIDETNERWEELRRRPEWSFHGGGYPPRDALLASRNRVIARHPRTVFIGAHVANNPEDLAAVGRWLDEYPNLHVDLASRISELGRQPYTARRFFLKYADRILLGTDGPWPETRIGLYWRFLETRDEYFPYSEKPFPPQGFWQIYGLGLPDRVLRQVYHENAARLIPGVSERLAAWRQRPPGRPHAPPSSLP